MTISELLKILSEGDRLKEDIAQFRRTLQDQGTDEVLAQQRALVEELEDLLDQLEPDAAVPPPPPSDILTPSGLALVIGHTARAQGAKGLSPPFPANDRTTNLHESHEYAWNMDLAQRIKQIADAAGIRCGLFFRDGVGIAGAYQAVKAWAPAATIELHFNATPSARGSLVLYGADASKEWAQALQTMMVGLYDRRGRFEDRGIHIPSAQHYRYGRKSVTQLHPSALLEPFFGDNPIDAALGIRLKQQLANGILRTFAAFTNNRLNAAAPVVDPAPPIAVSGDASIPDVPLLRQLITTYRDTQLAVTDLSEQAAARLKGITLAQWIEETGWARSELASLHSNFAGMKAIAEVERIIAEVPAAKVRYDAHDGRGVYLRFNDIPGFLRGYYMFLERSPYAGWRSHAEKSPHDFIRFIGRKWATKPGYAERVIALERRLKRAGIVAEDGRLFARDAPAPAGNGDRGGIVDPAKLTQNGATAVFLKVAGPLLADRAQLAPAQPVLVAQWALETNWGRSDLAVAHFNFAGVGWSNSLAGHAVAVPHPTDPARGQFCRFLSPEAFVAAVEHIITQTPEFEGWQDYLADHEKFASFLGRIWRPADGSYADKVRAIVSRITVTAPSHSAAPRGSGNAPVARQGVILRVDRVRSERRQGKSRDRTIGTYQLYVDGKAVDGVSGMMCETQGPGDNTATGKNSRRVEEGRYPLFTHSGSTKVGSITKFKTHGHTSNDGLGKPPMPSIRLGNTNRRTGILVHPGAGYVWSVGCLNPSETLHGAGDEIGYKDSRLRTISIIDAIKAALGGGFPDRNNKRIDGVTIEIVGEPGPAGSDALSGRADEAAFAQAELSNARNVFERRDSATVIGSEQAFAALAAAMSASAILGRPEPGEINNALEIGIELRALRGEDGETLWHPWALAHASALAQNNELREPIIAQLLNVAGHLAADGVPIHEGQVSPSPTVTAATLNAPETLAVLAELGAPLDDHDASGVTPLLASIDAGSAEAALWLLAQGADPNKTVQEPSDLLVKNRSEFASIGADAQTLLAERATTGGDARFEDDQRIAAALWARQNR
jgi:flagellum-specific peptidoglycan hydrolase FlgJ/N-acetylmuramoyl-L-alanine amidase